MKALLCVALAAVLLACTPSEWRPLKVSEAGFSVLMRGQPNYMKQDLPTPAGPMTAHLYSSDRPASYYAIGYSDYPLGLMVGEDPQKVFAGVRDTWVRRINGRVAGPESQLTLAGRYPGLEFSAEGTAKGEEAFVQARVYLVDQRLFQLIAMGRKNQVPQGEVNRFLNSFELIQSADVNTLRIRPEGK